MCILLIGGAGFVGVNFLIRYYKNELLIIVDPAELTVVGNYIQYKQTIQEFVESGNFKNHNITKIICLAADSFVPTCGKDGFINNVEIAKSVIYLLRYYENWKFRKLGHENDFCPSVPCLFFITDEIFDKNNVLSCCGNHYKFNQSYYSMSKFISYELVKDYGICLAFPPNLFGHYQKKDCIIKKILNNKLEYIEDTGEQQRYFMKVDNIVDVMYDWVNQPFDTDEFNNRLFKHPWFKLSINELVEKVFGLNVPHKKTRDEMQDMEYMLDYENFDTQITDFKEIYDFINYTKRERPRLKRTSNSSSPCIN